MFQQLTKAYYEANGDIGQGQLLYLKGQPRILTVLSLCAVVHQRKATLREVSWQFLGCDKPGCL